MGFCVSGHEVRTEKVHHLVTFITGMQLVVSNAHQRKALFVMPYVKTAMRQLIIVLIFFVFLTGCGFKSAKSYFTEAENLSEQGKYDEAILLLDKAIEKDQKFLGACINRGADKAALGDYQGAIEDYLRVLQIDPKNTLALFNIGNNYKRLEDFNKTVEYYNQAFDTKGGQLIYIDYTPNNVIDLSEFDVEGHEINYERGIAYYNIDSLERAFTDFNASIKSNYMPAESYWWLGYIYISRGQTDFACENFKKSKQLGDKDAEQELTKYCNE